MTSKVIAEDQTVIFHETNGRMFFQEIKKSKTIRIGKVFCDVTSIVGQQYGTVFEAQGRKMVPVTDGFFPTSLIADEGVQVPTGDNRDYADTNSAQQLTQESILAMKKEGTSGTDLIKVLVENSDTWNDKTEFSKQKYLKKKQQKHMPRVRVVECTAAALCDLYYANKPMKIGYLRKDAVASILTHANIAAGSKVLVVDTCMGLITGAIAERMGGYGTILAGYCGQQPASDALRRFNFDDAHLKTITHFPFHYLQQLDQPEEHVLVLEEDMKPSVSAEKHEEIKQKIEERKAQYSERERAEYDAKKQEKTRRKQWKRTPTEIRNLLRSPCDSLVLSSCAVSGYDVTDLMKHFFPLLGFSKPFVIFCEYLQPLVEVFHQLQKSEQAIGLQLFDTWTREYQVLPSRTHPEMNMQSCSGYLLSGIKVSTELVVPEGATLAPKPPNRRNKRPKSAE